MYTAGEVSLGKQNTLSKTPRLLFSYLLPKRRPMRMSPYDATTIPRLSSLTADR